MKRNMILGMLAAVLAVTIVVVLTVGPVKISVQTVAGVLWSAMTGASLDIPDTVREIILNVRLPRILLAALVGAALGVSGCAMQGLFRNPMASPYVCGVSSGGAFGASLIIVLGLSHALIVPSAFLFSIVTVFLVYYLAKTGNRVPIETLLLSGIALSLFFSALVSFIQYLANEGQLQEIVFWLMGGLWTSGWNKVLVSGPLIIVGTVALMFLHRELNILLTGEEQAQDVGVEVERARKTILVLTALVTSAAVAACGIIGFVGLVMPHLMRIFIGPDNRYLLPGSALAGALYLVLIDTFARTLISPTELPVGIITSMIGVPFFLFILRRRKGTSGF